MRVSDESFKSVKDRAKDIEWKKTLKEAVLVDNPHLDDGAALARSIVADRMEMEVEITIGSMALVVADTQEAATSGSPTQGLVDSAMDDTSPVSLSSATQPNEESLGRR